MGSTEMSTFLYLFEKLPMLFRNLIVKVAKIFSDCGVNLRRTGGGRHRKS